MARQLASGQDGMHIPDFTSEFPASHSASALALASLVGLVGAGDIGGSVGIAAVGAWSTMVRGRLTAESSLTAASLTAPDFMGAEGFMEEGLRDRAVVRIQELSAASILEV